MPDFMQQDQQFSLQEVAQHCGLAPYIIRYWEIHFPQLAGSAGVSKSVYTSNDVALIWRIKKLLYVDHLTIDQAKAQLEMEQSFPVQYPGLDGAVVGTTQTHVETQSSEIEEPNTEPIVQASVVEVPRPIAQESINQDSVEVQNKFASQESAVSEQQNKNGDEDTKLLEQNLTELRELRARVEEMTREIAVLRDARESLMHENEDLKCRLQQYEEAQAGVDASQLSLARENEQLKTTVNDIISQLKQMSSSLTRD